MVRAESGLVLVAAVTTDPDQNRHTIVASLKANSHSFIIPLTLPVKDNKRG